VKASIISPERVLFEGDVSSLVAPAFDGAGGSGRRFNVSGGFLQVADDVVRVVTESATPVA
jgi:F-type H+-transporting ATPase subunit epsilon